MATDREARVSEVLAWSLRAIHPHEAPSGHWLVVDDRDGHARRLLEAEGVHVDTWFRHAWGGVDAEAEPPRGPFAGIVLRLPHGHAAMRLVFHQVAALLAPDATLLVGGANDEGIKPVGKRLLEVVQQVEVVATRRHCRTFRGREPAAELRPALDDWSKGVRAEVSGIPLTWTSWPGLFAHGRLDAGTRLLLETLPPLEGRVLDFACGAGVVASFLQRRGDPVQLSVSDVDALALRAVERNVPEAERFLADGLPTEGGPWDVIVSNPPVHLGKEGHRGVVQALAATAPHRLTRHGVVWLVVQGTVPVHRALEASFADVQRVERNASYAVWRVASPRR